MKPSARKNYALFATVLGILTIISGTLVLVGWQLDSYTLQTFGLGGVTMKANTALSFLLLGMALVLLQRGDRRINIVLARIFSGVIALLGLLVLSQYVFTVNFGIDEFFFRDVPNAINTSSPGRMAPNTSLNFVLLGIALFAFSYRKMQKSFLVLILFVTAFSISMAGLFGNISGLEELAGLAVFTKMAVNTSAVFIILCTGIYFTLYNNKIRATLEYKLLAGLTVASVLIIFVSIISISSIKSLVTASGRVEHTQNVKQELVRVSSQVYELVSGDRGYIITGNDKYLRQWAESKENIPGIMDKLRVLTSDNPKQQKALITLNQLLKDRIDLSDLLIDTYKTKGRDAAFHVFESLKGEQVKDTIGEILLQMSDEENRLLSERHAKEEDNANNTLLIIILNLSVQLVLLAFIFVFVKKDITGRRRAEIELQKLNEELEERVNERTIALQNELEERKKAEEKIKKANRIYAVLSNINQAIVRVKDKQTLFDDACRIAVEDGKFRMAWIGIFDPQTNKVIPVASDGFTEDYMKTVNIDLNDEIRSKGPTGMAIKSGIHYLANDIANNSEMIPWRENALKLGYKSVAAFPLTVFGKVIGNLNLYANEPFFFDKAEIKLLDELAMDISFAVEFNENELKRQQTDIALRDSEKQLTLIYETVGDVIFQLEVEKEGQYRFVSVNPAFLSTTGLNFEQVVEKHVREVIPEPSLTLALSKYEEAIRQKKIVRWEETTEYPTGRLTGEVSIAPVFDEAGNCTSLVGAVHDITERKLAEEKVQLSEELFKSSFQNSPIGMALVSPEGKWLKVNSVLCTIVGYSEEELLTKTFQDITHPDDLEADLNHVRQLLAGEIDSYSIEKRYFHKDEKIIWVLLSVALIRSNDSTPSYFISQIEDISDWKLAVEKIRNMNAELETKVAERTNQLTEINEELSNAKLEAEQANLAKSEFLSRMSHELRTPMNSILGFAQLMNMGELAPAHKKGVDHILKAGKHLLELINEVLDLSRIEAGQLSVSLEPVQLHGIVLETLDIIRPLAVEKNITLEFPASPINDFFVKSDRQKLKQVLLNLVNNAVKFNRDDGSVKVEVGSPQWAVGSQQWAVGSPQLAVGSQQSAVGSPQWAVRLKTADWRLKIISNTFG